MNDAELELKGPFLGRCLRGESERRRYEVPEDLRTAAEVALYLQMPLLLTGEPGCGKTDFAWAAASALCAALRASDPRLYGCEDPVNAKPLQVYVRSESRARDLLYHYDALGRFGDGQHGGEPTRARTVFPYLRLEALGQALLSPRRLVVLIDEIDKAPRDLPNDLLRELEQGYFDIPEIPPGLEGPLLLDTEVAAELKGLRLKRRMERPPSLPMPLVIITSNAERQLPDAFLRRCVFFHIPFPDEPQMRQIIAAQGVLPHRPASPRGGAPSSDELLEPALQTFYRLRAVPRLIKKPATVELLGWLRALALRLSRGEDVLGRLRRFIDGSGDDWSQVPLFGCLIKQSEDGQRLRGAS